ncbi:MAG: M1 family aminopeptidase [Bryobacteraceae bacterium]
MFIGAHLRLIVPAVAAPPIAELARSIRQAGLNPDECYRVHDLSFQKEDIRMYLTEGYLIFSKPVSGQTRSALFTAEVEGGDGEVIVLPPYRGERQSLALFTQSANLDEHFRAAVIVFTDNSAEALRDRIETEGSGKKVKEMGALLAEQWTPTLTNIESSFEMRMVGDLLGPPQDAGLMFVGISGRQLGNFDLLYDPFRSEQIMAGQLTERDGHLTYSIWTSFASRNTRNRPPRRADPRFTLANFRIEAALDSELRMKATTRITVRVGADPVRVFPFNIAHAMHVTAVRIDGAPAELFFQDSVRARALRGYDNDVFLVAPAEPLAAHSEHEFEFEHDGAVIVSAGNGVFYVAARSTWYPRSGEAFASYDLTFRYPKRLTLVTTGDLLEDRTDGDSRVTHRRTPVPIRQAGFNLGEYEKISGTAPGYTIEVYANRYLAAAFQPKPATQQPQIGQRPPPRYGRNLPSPSQAPPEIVSPPDPLARLQAVAASVSSSLEFFASRFGPPALKTLTVAPIPGTFGQGFPGLVYLSTLSYLDPRELPPEMRNAQRELFFSDLIEAHEVAHQWWGNVVTSDSYQDDWLPEALSSYSALLWLEKKRGTKAMEGVLDGYREHLLTKDGQGRTIESAGPIVWGTRIDSRGMPDAWRLITYEKGAWILHMLRRRLGDDQFLKMLAEMQRRYEFRSASTEDFRALAKEFRPAKTSADSIDGFFDHWVYSTGVPLLKVQSTMKVSSAKGTAPAVRVSGTLTASGVDDDFSVEVPVELQFAKGSPRTIWVSASNESVPFTATVSQMPLRVVVPSSGVLSAKK